ncbi:MAG: hypothetical protein K8H86_05670 [Ignavibacteriaceae bacterium]|nr:hypothetical protein [Ignavibacteriaceae bacterium]
MKKIKLLLLLFIISFTLQVYPQVQSPSLIFNRGKLWQSVFFGKIGPNFSNWGKRGIALDWPGFDDSWLRENIGGSPSYMVTGGFWVGGEWMKDSIVAVEDWSLYAGTISNDASAKYTVTKHKKNQNWEQTDPNSGDESIETVWEYNFNYTNVDDRESILPLRVTRKAHQWNGSQRDENYILYDYIFKNISDEVRLKDPARKVADTLYNFYLLLNYGLEANSRGWNILFPSLSSGARNTWFFYDPTRKMIWGRAADYPLTVADETYDYSANSGPLLSTGDISGEWLAPGFVGVRLIYASPNKNNKETFVNQYGWSAGSNSIDLSGPFTGIPGTREAKYEVLKDIRNAFNYVNSPGDTVYMKKSRMWSMMSLGPWDIMPGDSIVVAIAEIVDGISYAEAIDPQTKANIVGQIGQRELNNSADKAKFTYDNNFNHPDPPVAPEFDVDFYRGTGQIAANEIIWGTGTESVADPDDGTLDLAGYKIYRSNYLPIGPWSFVGDVKKGATDYYSTTDGKYHFIDSTADVGVAYFYALTAYDTGKASWQVNPSAIFKETGSNKVPPLESSIYANKKVIPFTTTFKPAQSLNNIVVVPNPFVIGDKYAVPGAEGSDDIIQFVNVPNPCTIRIYSVRGDLIKTIEASEGTGAIVSWDQTTSYGQFVESGIYIYHVESKLGEKIGKLAIVR